MESGGRETGEGNEGRGVTSGSTVSPYVFLGVLLVLCRDIETCIWYFRHGVPGLPVLPSGLSYSMLRTLRSLPLREVFSFRCFRRNSPGPSEG